MIINFSNIGGGSGSGSGLSPDNYYTKSQIDGKGYVTSADSVNYATSADIKTITDHIEESEEVISTAINDLNSRIASGGSGGANQVVYVDNLNFTGETDKLYVYNNKLYRWITESGSVATYVGAYSTGGSSANQNLTIYFDYLPQSFNGALIFSSKYNSAAENHYVYYDFQNNRFLDYSTSQVSPLEGTPDTTYTFGNTYTLQHGGSNSNRLVKVLFDLDKIVFCDFGSVTITQINHFNINGPHFELVDKKDRFYHANTSTSGRTYETTNGIPVWNEQGIIIRKEADVFERTFFINATSGSANKLKWLAKDNVGFASNIYVPTTSGNDGDILKSNGNAAPTWITLASLMGGLTVVNCSEADYESMGSHDSSTLYIIDPEAE